MANVTWREYNPESGALLGNISISSYGKITSGAHTRVKVIDIVFSGVTSVSNVKLGIISDGGITVNEGPEDIASDGSSSNGHFGIESSSSFMESKTSQPLFRHFAGLNSDGTSSNDNNVSIGTRTATITNYIYIDVEVGSGNKIAGNGAYKLFFDYT